MNFNLFLIFKFVVSVSNSDWHFISRSLNGFAGLCRELEGSDSEEMLWADDALTRVRCKCRRARESGEQIAWKCERQTSLAFNWLNDSGLIDP